MLFRQLLLPLQCRFERKWLFCDCKSNYFFYHTVVIGHHFERNLRSIKIV